MFLKIRTTKRIPKYQDVNNHLIVEPIIESTHKMRIFWDRQNEEVSYLVLDVNGTKNDVGHVTTCGNQWVAIVNPTIEHVMFSTKSSAENFVMYSVQEQLVLVTDQLKGLNWR
jgi:hypothetical protein